MSARRIIENSGTVARPALDASDNRKEAGRGQAARDTALVILCHKSLHVVCRPVNSNGKHVASLKHSYNCRCGRIEGGHNLDGVALIGSLAARSNIASSSTATGHNVRKLIGDRICVK